MSGTVLTAGIGEVDGEARAIVEKHGARIEADPLCDQAGHYVDGWGLCFPDEPTDRLSQETLLDAWRRMQADLAAANYCPCCLKRLEHHQAGKE